MWFIYTKFPEADHKEISGWEGARQAAPMSAIFLEDRDQHPRVRQRSELTAALIEPHARYVTRIETEGESRTERLLWSVMRMWMEWDYAWERWEEFHRSQA